MQLHIALEVSRCVWRNLAKNRLHHDLAQSRHVIPLLLPGMIQRGHVVIDRRPLPAFQVETSSTSIIPAFGFFLFLFFGCLGRAALQPSVAEMPLAWPHHHHNGLSGASAAVTTKRLGVQVPDVRGSHAVGTPDLWSHPRVLSPREFLVPCSMQLITHSTDGDDMLVEVAGGGVSLVTNMAWRR